MQIVVEFGPDPQAYLDQFAQAVQWRPELCPNCQAAASLIGHGFYPRQALALAQVFPLRIRRWYCRRCHRTTSLLPSFLLRHRWYLLAVIQTIVVARFEHEQSWRQVAAGTVAGAPSTRTLRRWSQSFAQHAPAWLAVVLTTLAAHDPATPLLDALGRAAQPRQSARPLLAAALHLLAWAKTHWADLAGYGLSDRLRFLWHWGHRRGLARLV